MASGASASTNEDTGLTGTLTGTDLESSTLTFSKVTDPSHGTVTVNAATGAYTYTPTANYNGADLFTFKVNDGTVDSAAATMNITVRAVNDSASGVLTITGVATQGQTLVAGNTLSDADGIGVVSYQWKAGDANISGATGSTYTLTQSEVGKAITVVASYTDSGNTAESVSSSATGSVVNVNDAPTGSVSITGTATQGQTLTASNTLADADGLGTRSYQWKSGGVNISGATGSTYKLTQSEVGKAITLVASYTDGGNTAESVSSSATSSVVNVNDAPTGSVSITGTATQGQTLTASNTLADVDGLGNVSYQWKSGGANISGATSSTYTLTQSEVGKAITVLASYTDGGNTAESVSSSATSSVVNVNDAPTGSVSITGTATQGQTLTASNTLADADGLGAISYQWKAAGTNISGATGSTYTLTQSEVGKAITVVVSYTDSGNTVESVSSSATSSVVNVNDAPTGTVTISGTATQGQTLTVSNTLADADGMGIVSYQWKAGGTNISGAKSSTYTLTQSEVGKAITVVASYTDGFGQVEMVNSVATNSVSNTGIGNLEGQVYDWKSHALLSGVGVKLTQKSSVAGTVTPLFELKGLALNAQGDASAELWVNFKEAAGSLDLTLQFDKTISGSFIENTSALPSGWSLIPGGDAGLLTLGGMGLTDASGSVKLGVVNFDLPTGVSAAQIKLVDGSAGSSNLTPYAVSVGGAGLNATTGADGKYGFELLDAGTYQLDMSKALTTAETGSAINSADALAALKIAVGRNPNADPDGTGPLTAPVVSPYQFIAADANQDGKVTSADALAILKMAVKRTDAPVREWLFVNENQDFWNETTSSLPGSFTTTRSSVVWEKALQLSSPLTTEQNVVAVLKGDVNGSWTPPAGSQDLDVRAPGYFEDLSAKLGAPAYQWAVIG